MARPLRIDLVEGWYHVTARGNERKAVFLTDPDRRHFVELLEQLAERFGWRVHAYVLMSNHYHLLAQTPHANLSAGMQWLGVSYSVWFNRRHRRSGHLFQGRFKAVVLEQAAALEVSRYVHLNPVRVVALGLGKAQRQRQAAGLAGPPSAATVRERVKRLREFRWSSYRAYAGWERPSAWLSVAPVLSMLGGGSVKAAPHRYRQYVEAAVRDGLAESPWERLEAGVLLGSEEFVRQTKAMLKGNVREQPSLRQLRRRCGLPQVIRVVEQLKAERWERFRDRHADWGRDAVLWLARRHCGMTLRELGQAVGGVDYVTVSTAVRRLERRAARDKRLAGALTEAEIQLQNAKM
jgi:REP-associated tyrosine transposase